MIRLLFEKKEKKIKRIVYFTLIFFRFVDLVLFELNEIPAPTHLPKRGDTAVRVHLYVSVPSFLIAGLETATLPI